MPSGISLKLCSIPALEQIWTGSSVEVVCLSSIHTGCGIDVSDMVCFHQKGLLDYCFLVIFPVEVTDKVFFPLFEQYFVSL